MQLDLDTVYVCPKDYIWQYIKNVIPSDSIDLCIYKPCDDIYTAKKTIWNTLSRLKQNALFCIECNARNLSYIINILQESKYDCYISCCVSKEMMAFYIFAFQDKFLHPFIQKVYYINNWSSDIPSILANMIDFGQNILVLGDSILPYVPAIKEMRRYVIAMGGDEIFIEIAVNSGLRKIIL